MKTIPHAFFLVVFTLLAVAPFGCMDRELVRVDPVTQSFVSDEFATAGSAGVDVLVLVDNSKSMTDEQALLVTNFPELIRSLLQPVDAVDNRTGEPAPDGKADHMPVKDMHIGVVSSDMGTGGFHVGSCADSLDGDDGILQNVPNPLIAGCDSYYPKHLSRASEEPPPVREPGAAALPEIEKLAKDFGCIATLGNQGCGFEQQLEAVLKALTTHSKTPAEGGTGQNAGFLRPETILAVIFVTDEEDCSVDTSNPDNLRIFDETLDAQLGYMNVRCAQHPEMVHAIDRYATGFASLRTNKEDFVMGIIAGVPPADLAPECNGFAEQIGGCLDNDLMQAVVNPDNPRRMRQSCVSTDPDEGAYPPRRLVELVQRFTALSPDTLGRNVYVQSICAGDYTPAIAAITGKIHELVDKRGVSRELEIVKDPDDPRGCACTAVCDIIEMLPGSDPCAAPKESFDGNGDTVGDTERDDAGNYHTLCRIPHAGMTITAEECACCASTSPAAPGDCRCAVPCNDAGAGLVQRVCQAEPCPATCIADTAGTPPRCLGWWYDPVYDTDGPGPVAPAPTIVMTDAVPGAGSKTRIQCNSEICPEMRACGTARCCAANEYCWVNPQDEDEKLCLIRPDVCAEYGDDLWCPAQLYGMPADYQGVCCLDHDMDGRLDMADIDGDGLDDTPEYRCDGTTCTAR